MLDLGKKQQGVTILETLLAMVIIALIMVLAIRQYTAYRYQIDLQQIQNNVVKLFQGLSGYYYANCGLTGTLSPSQSSPFVLDFTQDLMNKGYTSSLTPNRLINNNGYVVQFNKYLAPKQICTDGNMVNGVCSGTMKTIGSVLSWRMQVSVLLNDVSQRTTYVKLLRADCLSSMQGSSVRPCSDKQIGNYLVWERQPSYSSENLDTVSSYWVSMPILQQFNQMYTTNPVLQTTQGDHTTEYQYYYCGS